MARARVQEEAPRSNKDKRRRLNAILDICKIRKDVNAIECFDSDCEHITETPIMSGTKRRKGDGSIKETKHDTGNIIIACDVHGWKQLCSVSQLDFLPMPARTTTVNPNAPSAADPEGNVVER